MIISYPVCWKERERERKKNKLQTGRIHYLIRRDNNYAMRSTCTFRRYAMSA